MKISAILFSRLRLNTMFTACLGLILSTISLSQAALVEIDPVTGNTGPACGADGKCNPGACNNDPDCPKLPSDLPPPPPRPAESVQSSCGGTVALEADDSTLALAADAVRARFPNFNAAEKSKNPKYFDSHPTGPIGTGHGELKGYGVTMIQGTRSNPVLNASGKLDDPTELFFHKDGSNQDNWEIIGMGYAFSYERNGEATPTLSGIPSEAWLIHEAGYHHSPGDGRFTCATDDDLKQSAIDAGKKIDRDGCLGISKDDLKNKLTRAEHGRIWTVHIWFDPHTKRPTITTTDPWCRQSSKAIAVPSRAFFKQGSCS